MAHPYHHSLSSVKRWGGTVKDYAAIHEWFDESKKITADFRNRGLRHHAEGIFMDETIFGSTLTLSTGRIIPTRWVGEQHVREDLGFIPSFVDWVRSIRPEAWMGRTGQLEVPTPVVDQTVLDTPQAFSNITEATHEQRKQQRSWRRCATSCWRLNTIWRHCWPDSRASTTR